MFPVLLAFVSLFFPYRTKVSDWNTGNEAIKIEELGYSFELGLIVVTMLVLGVVIKLLFRYKYAELVFALGTVAFCLLLWQLTHFQGLIDHKFDTHSGIGFKMLFFACSWYFVSSIYKFSKQGNRKTVIDR